MSEPMGCLHPDCGAAFPDADAFFAHIRDSACFTDSEKVALLSHGIAARARGGGSYLPDDAGDGARSLGRRERPVLTLHPEPEWGSHAEVPMAPGETSGERETAQCDGCSYATWRKADIARHSLTGSCRRKAEKWSQPEEEFIIVHDWDNMDYPYVGNSRKEGGDTEPPNTKQEPSTSQLFPDGHCTACSFSNTRPSIVYHHFVLKHAGEMLPNGVVVEFSICDQCEKRMRHDSLRDHFLVCGKLVIKRTSPMDKQFGEANSTSKFSLFPDGICSLCSYSNQFSSRVYQHFLCKHAGELLPNGVLVDVSYCDGCQNRLRIRSLPEHFLVCNKKRRVRPAKPRTMDRLRRFQCRDCPFEGSKSDVQYHSLLKSACHRRRRHLLKFKACSRCNFAGRFKGSLFAHLMVRHRRTASFGVKRLRRRRACAFVCPHCHFETKYHKTYRHHRGDTSQCAKFLNKDLFPSGKCSECEYQSHYPSSVVSHFRTNHRDKLLPNGRPLDKFECDSCKSIFFIKSSLVDHLKSCYKKMSRMLTQKDSSSDQPIPRQKKVHACRITDNLVYRGLFPEGVCSLCPFANTRLRLIYNHFLARHIGEALPNGVIAKQAFCDHCRRPIPHSALKSHKCRPQKETRAKTRPTTQQGATRHHRAAFSICPNCPFSSREEGELRRHQARKGACHRLRRHLLRFRACLHCPFVGPHSGSLFAHLQSTHRELTARRKLCHCPQCGFSTRNIHTLRLHMESLRACKMFRRSRLFTDGRCSECPFTSTRHRVLIDHFQHQHEDRPFPDGTRVEQLSCDTCDYSSAIKSNFRAHIRSCRPSHGRRPAKVERDPQPATCVRKKARRTIAKPGAARHHRAASFICPKCPFSSREEGELRRHQARKGACHRLRRHLLRFRACLHCPFVGRHSGSLFAHLQSTHRELTAKRKLGHCPQCGFATRNSHSLGVHMEGIISCVKFRQGRLFADGRCSECPFIGAHYHVIMDHFQRQHADCMLPDGSRVDQLTCDSCEFSSPIQVLFRAHVRNCWASGRGCRLKVKREQTPRSCDSCDFVCEQRQTLRNHVLSCSGLRGPRAQRLTQRAAEKRAKAQALAERQRKAAEVLREKEAQRLKAAEALQEKEAPRRRRAEAVPRKAPRREAMEDIVKKEKEARAVSCANCAFVGTSSATAAHRRLRPMSCLQRRLESHALEMAGSLDACRYCSFKAVPPSHGLPLLRHLLDRGACEAQDQADFIADMEPESCPSCGKETATTRGLRSHLRASKVCLGLEEGEELGCDGCGVWVDGPEKLGAHLASGLGCRLVRDGTLA